MTLVGDDMTVERWLIEAPTVGDGWVPNRFKITGTDDDGAFGWTKGQFGLFEGRGDTQFGWLELTSLTHLPSGMRIAIFAAPTTAAIAADLADRIGDWSEISEQGLVTQEWKDRAKRMYALWESAGLMCGPISTNGRGVWCAPEPIEKGIQ